MRITGAALVCGAAALAWSVGHAIAAKPNFSNVAPQAIEIKAVPFGPSESDPVSKESGKLSWLGGVELKSSSPYLGGYSGLVLSGDGTRLLAVSDAGLWLSARLTYRNGRIARFEGARTGSLRALKNRPLSKKRWRDAEAMAPTRYGRLGRAVYIGFEQLHRVGRFPLQKARLAGPVRYLKMPKSIRGAKGNKSLEGLALLTKGPFKGSLLALTEQFLDKNGDHRAWIVSTRTPKRLTLKRLDDFDVTGAATLPNGDVLILERRFSFTRGIAARIRRVAAADIKPGAKLNGKILLDLRGVTRIDNMEGIAVHRSPKGRTVVTLISDDNFNSTFQRTLLMQFILSD